MSDFSTIVLPNRTADKAAEILNRIENSINTGKAFYATGADHNPPTMLINPAHIISVVVLD